ncbi:MAG TPA: AraC family transcriptional regulator [Limnochordia bacterium]
MDWIRRLNRTQTRIPLPGGATAEVLHWAYSPHLPDNVRHRHTYFEACRVGAHGRGVYVVEADEHPIGPGDLFIARPGVLHQIRNTASPEMELFWVAYQLFPPAGRRLPDPLQVFATSPVVVSPDPGRRVAAVWDALRTVAAHEADAACAPLAASLFLLIADALSPPREEAVVQGRTAAEAAVHLAIRYVHDNLDQPLRASDVAQQANVSVRHLSRLFHLHTGVPFHAYVTRARLDRAVQLLRQTDLPIKAIGARVGYPDVHHFTRVFSRRIGQPPAAFRRGEGRVDGRNVQTRGGFV